MSLAATRRVGNIVELLGQPWEYREEAVIPPDIQLSQAIQDAGLHAPNGITFNGEIHRFSADGTRADLSGWYVAFSDGIPAGAFGTWKEEKKHQWRADIGRELTAVESMKVAERLRIAAELRDTLREQKHQQTAESCQQLWEAAEAAPEDHRYLQKKQVGSHGIKISKDGRLMLPLFTPEGELSTLQYIAESGKKLFHSGGKAGGCFWWLGDLNSGKRVYIAEGYATAASIYEVTGEPVVIAYNAKNLIPVTSSIRSMFPIREFIIVADNDESGTGKKCADEAAEKSGAEVIMPPEIGDANDFLLSGGDLKGLLKSTHRQNKFLDSIIRGANLHEQFLSTLNQSWSIKGVLPERAGLSVIYGKPGSYKSFIALDMAASMAAGINWQGKETRHKRVLYFAAEGQHGLLKRLEAWRQYHDIKTLNDLDVMPMACMLDNPQEVLLLMDALSRVEQTPEVIFMDTLARSMAGDENTKTDMGKVIEAVDMLRRETGAQIILIHHAGKDVTKGLRGSGSLEGATDTIFKTEVLEVKQVLFINERQKDDEPAADMVFSMEVVDTGFSTHDGDEVTSLVPVLDEDATNSSQRVGRSKKSKFLQTYQKAWIASGMEESAEGPYLSRSAFSDYLAKTFGYSERTIRNHLNPAYDQNIIGYLIRYECIRIFNHGWILLDDETVSASLLLKNG